jgi:histidinol dehydrogenase
VYSVQCTVYSGQWAVGISADPLSAKRPAHCSTLYAIFPRMKIVPLKSLRHPEIARLTGREPSPSPQIQKIVNDILARVRKEGHAAVLDYARRFDGLKGNLRVTPAELRKAADKAPAKVRSAIRKAIANVRKFHMRQKESSWTFRGAHGETLGQIIRPLDRVGIYVPGGAGVYPSTLIMNAVPARVAGVPEIAMVSPCARGLDPAVAYAALQLDVTEIYKVGGAQAVAMLAYGTTKVPRVDKITGPGNVYAALAKKEVFGTVDIDMVAGPSEILVLFDETADPDWVAADLLSQAEHGSGYEAVVGVTTSPRAARRVAECVRAQTESSPKRAIVEKAVERFGRIFTVPDWDLGCAVANALAPEHLEIITESPRALLPAIRNAGAVFLGPYSSEPVGDYFAGPNHVLPTNGSARFFSPLGVYDFCKRTSLIEYPAGALRREGARIAALADAEGFYHHAAAVRKRM